MENSKQNQESELRELSREELESLFGGVTYKTVWIDGELVLIEVEDK